METNINLSVLEKYLKEDISLDSCIKTLKDINMDYAQLSLYVEMVNNSSTSIKICANEFVLNNLEFLKSLASVFESMKGGAIC